MFQKKYLKSILSINLLLLSICLPMLASPNIAIAQEGVVPKSSLDIFPGMDPRLVGLPLGDSKYSASSEKLSNLEKNLEKLQTQESTIKARLSLLGVEKIERQRLKEEANTKYINAYTYHVQLLGELYYNTQVQTESVGVTIEDLKQYQNFESGKEMTKVLVVSSSKSLAAAKKEKEKTIKDLEETVNAIKNYEQQAGNLKKNLISAKASVDEVKNVIKESLPAAPIDGIDIPVMTMDAYLRAEKRMQTLNPECAVKWWGLAGIGRTESNHGRFNGAKPDSNGNVSPPVIGIALDGNGVAAISDTDNGLYDGDSVWDRAVGPMQFIPQTWKAYAIDNNGDGVINPQNLYDTALATARYMCKSAQGMDLTSDAGLTRAYLSYNHSSAYAALCLARAKNYKEAYSQIA